MESYHLSNRPDREITSVEELQAILFHGKYAVLSLSNRDEPYVVTLSYGYDVQENALYFHAAPSGMKMDYIRANPNVCGTVIEDGGYEEDRCSHPFRTVVFRGKMSVVKELPQKMHGMFILLNHLEKNPDYVQQMLLKSENRYAVMTVLKLEITDIHGKAGK